MPIFYTTSNRIKEDMINTLPHSIWQRSNDSSQWGDIKVNENKIVIVCPAKRSIETPEGQKEMLQIYYKLAKYMRQNYESSILYILEEESFSQAYTKSILLEIEKTQDDTKTDDSTLYVLAEDELAFRPQNSLSLDNLLKKVTKSISDIVRSFSNGNNKKSPTKSQLDSILTSSMMGKHYDHHAARGRIQQFKPSKNTKAFFSKGKTNSTITREEFDEYIKYLKELNTNQLDFVGTVKKFQEEKQLTDAQVYRGANISRSLFDKYAKSKNKKLWRPDKNTVLALSIGLRLDLNETNRLLLVADRTPLIPLESVTDAVVYYNISIGNYDINSINQMLGSYGLENLGSQGVEYYISKYK